MKMIKFFFCAVLSLLLVSCHANSNEKKIGIIIPIEHQSLNEIVSGFKEELQNLSKSALTFNIANAQGDINLERAMLQQLRNQHYDLIVPIGTDATRMALATNKQQMILSLAASFSKEERAKQKPCHIAVVHDQIPAEKSLQLIHAAFPQIKQISLVHSTSDKVFPEVDAAVLAGKKLGIVVKPQLSPSLNELYSIGQSLPKESQAIFILKDNLIASGVSTLAINAAKRGIPLIASDQGSVENGAAFALGVTEREIGIQGAKLAKRILAGENPCELPIIEMNHFIVFINEKALAHEKQSSALLQRAAKHLKYRIKEVSLGNGK